MLSFSPHVDNFVPKGSKTLPALYDCVSLAPTGSLLSSYWGSKADVTVGSPFAFARLQELLSEMLWSTYDLLNLSTMSQCTKQDTVYLQLNSLIQLQ